MVEEEVSLVVGEDVFLKGFEEQLIGHVIGEPL